MTPQGNGPLCDAEVLADSLVWSLREARQTDDAAVRALHVRRAFRLISAIRAILLGIP